MVKKLVLGVFFFLIVAFAAAQLVRPDMANPPVDPANTVDSMSSMPAEVKPIFKKACADCHTNETRYPWYSKITPVNFWLQDHIRDGRRHLNLSTGRGDIDEICKEITRDKMPLPSYRWGHPEAVLTAEEKKILCDWSKAAEGGENEENEREEHR